MKLGLQGTSTFVSSGDYGVGIWANDASPDGCLNSTDPDHPHLRVFNPPDPATCPYVTSVGGTRLYPGQTVGDAESVMDIPEADPTFGSGGGFSNVYDAPAYQREAIEEYFTHHDPGLVISISLSLLERIIVRTETYHFLTGMPTITPTPLATITARAVADTTELVVVSSEKCICSHGPS
jgi:hypothetical protein